jgi:hypothetical protein
MELATNKKSYTTKISSEQADKLTQETTKKELDALNKLLQTNPELLKRRKSLEIIDDDDINLDNSDKEENHSDSNLSDSSDSSDSSNSFKKKKNKKNKKSSKKHNKSYDIFDSKKDLVSKKDITIDKLESENRYIKLDLSNATVKNMELGDKVSKNEKLIKFYERNNEFYSTAARFLETNYLNTNKTNLKNNFSSIQKIIEKSKSKPESETSTQNNLNTNSNTNSTISTNTNYTINSNTKVNTEQNDSKKFIKDVIKRIEDISDNIYENLYLISLTEMESIITTYTKAKSSVLDDYKNIMKLSEEKSIEEFNINHNFLKIYFIRRVNYKKDSVIKQIDEKIKYYSYLYKVEKIAYKMVIGIILIYIGYALIKFGIKIIKF